MKALKTFLSKYMGFTILGIAMLYAIISVLYHEATYEKSDVKSIRICHWQLEAGFRESLQVLIDDFERDHEARTGEKVRVLQAPISERAYQQYINTGLIGDMAPDIIEKGMAKTARDPSYVARFFRPLGNVVTKPNPFNKGTALEGVPWKDTFLDGMQSAYDENLLDYYFIPFSMFTIRIYYNKELYEKVLGRTDPPHSYLDFISICKKIKGYQDEDGKFVIPIAASKAQGSYFGGKYKYPFLRSLAKKCDMDFNASANVFETFLYYKNKVWDFYDPALIESARCLMDIASNFQDGWLAAQRDDALFMFAQNRAVMIASGSWDAQSIIDQTKAIFNVGIFDFPMPTDDPVYGKFVKGGSSEAGSGGGIPWSINKKTKYPDLCIEFLQYCTTKANNERFNSRITWLPIVRGVKITDERLKAFKPKLQGYTGDIDYNISTAVSLLGSGNRWTLYSGQMTPEQNAGEMQEMYDRTSDDGYYKQLDLLYRRARNTERVVASKLALRVSQNAKKRAELTSKLVKIDQALQIVDHNYYSYQHRYEIFEKEQKLAK
jgi:raffinose/stachyose/melibiose transport system substrate-binding protein